MSFKNYTDRGNKEVLSSDINNMLNMNKYFIKDNDVSITLTDDFEVTIGAGTAVFSKVDVAFSETPITISAPNDSQDRIDIITLDNLGVISLIEGTPSVLPETPYYDADNDMCLCSIRVKQSCKALTSAMLNPNFLIRKMPQSTYDNAYVSSLLNYQKMEILELDALTTMGITTETFQIVNDTFSEEAGLLATVNTANTTAVFSVDGYYASTSGDFVEIDLPTITGTYTNTALIVDWDKKYEDTITYDVTDGTNTDAGLIPNNKNYKSSVTSNPTKIRINLNKDSINPIFKYPKVKTYSLIIYK